MSYYPVKPLPSDWRRKALIFLACTLIAGGMFFLAKLLQAEWLVWIGVAAAALIGNFFFWKLYCPECGELLPEGGKHYNQDQLGQTGFHRDILHCEQCQIDWATSYRWFSESDE